MANDFYAVENPMRCVVAVARVANPNVKVLTLTQIGRFLDELCVDGLPYEATVLKLAQITLDYASANNIELDALLQHEPTYKMSTLEKHLDKWQITVPDAQHILTTHRVAGGVGGEIPADFVVFASSGNSCESSCNCPTCYQEPSTPEGSERTQALEGLLKLYGIELPDLYDRSISIEKRAMAIQRLCEITHGVAQLSKRRAGGEDIKIGDVMDYLKSEIDVINSMLK